MKNRKFPLRQLLVVCYGLAAALWLVVCVVRGGIMLNYKMKGEMPAAIIAPEQLVTEGFVPYTFKEWWVAPDERPEWYLSTDNDSHIFWQGQGYLEQVKLLANHLLPPAEVTLYYLLPGQTDYSEKQKIFGRVTGEAEYTFDLGGLYVTGLRIDPDRLGGVPALFYGVELNPADPWFLRLVPDGGQLLVLLFAPALAAAALAAVQDLLKKDDIQE